MHFPLFTEIGCEPLTPLKNSYILPTHCTDSLVHINDTCTLVCDTGYELSGVETVTCQKDGKYSDEFKEKSSCVASMYFYGIVTCLRAMPAHLRLLFTFLHPHILINANYFQYFASIFFYKLFSLLYRGSF